MENKKRILSIGLQIAAIFAVIIMISTPPAIAIETKVVLRDTQVLDSSTMDPIDNAYVELDCEATEGSGSDSGYTNESGMISKLDTGYMDDDEESEGKCGITIKADDYRNIEIDRDDDERNMDWGEGNPFGFWTKTLPRRSAWLGGILLATTIGATAAYWGIYIAGLTILGLGTGWWVGKGAILGAKSALSLFKGKAIAKSILTGGAVGAKFSLGISLVVAAAIAGVMHFYGTEIYCAITGLYSDRCQEEIERERMTFTLEPEEDDTATPTDYATIQNVNNDIHSSQVTGRVTQMTKHQLNAHLIKEGINLDPGEEKTQIINVTQGKHSDCMIMPHYPNNPDEDRGGIRLDGNIEIEGEDQIGDIYIQPGHIYYFNVKGEQTTTAGGGENFTIKAQRITREPHIDLREEYLPDDAENITDSIGETLENLHNALGPCISDKQVSIDHARMLNAKTQERGGTVSYGDTYTPTPYYGEIEGERVGFSEALDEHLYCAPGDGTTYGSPDVVLLEEEEWSEHIGKYGFDDAYDSFETDLDHVMRARSPEEIDIDEDTKHEYECGTDEEGEQIYCPDGNQEFDWMDHSKEFECVDEETSTCIVKEEADDVGEICGGNHREVDRFGLDNAFMPRFCEAEDECISFESGKCIDPSEEDLDTPEICVVEELEGKPPCDKDAGPQTDIEEDKNILRAPNLFGCGEPGSSRTGEGGKTCPPGTIFDSYRGEGCLTNTLYGG